MTDRESTCKAHVIYDGESLDCMLLARHRLPHEAERADGTTFEWDSQGTTRRAR